MTTTTSREVSIVATLQDSETFEIRAYAYTQEEKYAANQVFWWTEGNAACDCNRHDFFERVLSPDYDDDHLNDGDGFPCGHGRYVLLGLTIDGKPAELG